MKSILLAVVFILTGCGLAGRKVPVRLVESLQVSKADVEWRYIKKQGAIYEITYQGVTGDRIPPLGSMPSNYVVGDRIEKKSPNAAEFILSSPGDEDHYRDFKKGEKVYITELFTKKGQLHVFLLSVDTYQEVSQGETKSFRYVGSLIVPVSSDDPEPADVAKALAPFLKKI